jgi:nitrogen-specific signal transduction histidine kinase
MLLLEPPTGVFRARPPLRPRRKLAAAALLPTVLLAACASEFEVPPPRTLPFTLEPRHEYPRAAYGVDLDGDGADELIYVWRPEVAGGRRIEALMLQRHGGGVLEQINYDGRIVTHRFLDITGNGRREIVVGVVRNDSLFLSVADDRGTKLFSFFLIEGEPRMELDGEIPWDPFIHFIGTADVDGDGTPELVTMVTTGYARLPRGVLVHSLPDGRRMGALVVGAHLITAALDDFVGGGLPRLVATSRASSNGAAAGGFDDDHSHFLVFRLFPEVEVEWSRTLGGRFSFGVLTYADFTGDRERELLVMATSPHAEVELEFVEPGTWRPLRRHTLAAPLVSPFTLDLDRDGRPEIVAVRPPGDVWVLDATFERVRSRQVAPGIEDLTHVPDLDGDGVSEIVAVFRGGDNLASRGFALLGPDLRIKAVYPEGQIAGVLRRGVGVPPYVLVHQGERTIALSLTPNHLYLLYRHGALAAGGLGGAAILLATFSFLRLQRRSRLLRSVRTALGDGANQGLLLLDRRGRVRWANGTLRGWLGLEDGRRPRDLCELAPVAPEVVEFCRSSAAAEPPLRRTTAASLPSGGGRMRVQLAAEPLRTRTRGDPHWLIRFEEPASAPPQPPVDWAILAQRVAHDVKNPLTSMLLTLQHLQREYRERAPEATPELDRYATRIEQRIDQLRQLTNNFLKFVDLREIERSEVDLNRLVREFARSLERSLPPDIEVRLDLAESLSPVRVDEEQIRSLLGNLVTNAVNALARGGTITLATRLARGMHAPDAGDARDYLLLEVLDTGEGVPAHLQEQIFAPGFSTAEHGSGLGLALVRKVAADHGGHVTVESEEGTGSAFCVYLPLEG